MRVGYDGSNRVNDFYEFSFNRRVWSVVTASGSPPSPRDRHVAVVYKDSFYVFAGFDGSSRVNDFIEYNFCAFAVACDFATPRLAALRLTRSMERYDGHVRSDAKVEQCGSHRRHAADATAQSRSSCLRCVRVCSVVSQLQRAAPNERIVSWTPDKSMFCFGGYDGSYRNDFHEFNFGTTDALLSLSRLLQTHARTHSLC